jgi:hypothetical protein
MKLQGYSYRLVKANQEADSDNVGVQLGRYCIAKNIPVHKAAEVFKVSRMTIYTWFTGQSAPHKKRAEKIKEALIKAKFSV